MRIVILALFAIPIWAACPAGYGYGRQIDLSARASTLTGFTTTLCFNGAVGSNCDPANANLNFPELKTTANGGKIQNTVTGTSPYSRTIPADFVLVDADGTTVLDFEIERYSATTGELKAHVEKTLTTAATTIYACYGNAAVTTDQSNSANTWDSNTMAAYHLADGSTLQLVDSTSNARTLTNNNAATGTTGLIDGGVGLASASSQYLSRATFVASMPAAMSASAWVNFATLANTYNTVLALQVDSAGGLMYFALHVKDNGKLACFAYSVGGVRAYDGTGTYTISAGTWVHLSMTYGSGEGTTCYVNGSVDGSSASNGTALNNLGNPNLSIGQDPAYSPRHVNGTIDEVRISNTVRSADWFAAEYANISSPSTFWTLGSEAQYGISVRRYRIIQ